jgi:hypothetical protein
MELEERAADPLAGGMMRGYQCGMVWGAALAAGARAYRLFGTGPQAETKAMIASQRVVESFRAQNNYVDCSEITGIDLASPPSVRAIVRFLIKSGATGSCFGMAARCDKATFREINTALADGACSADDIKALPAPASCSAMLAQEMGASDIHTVMAAGFAGGIGLSGSACGALGAAVWIIGMDILKDGGTLGLKVPRLDGIIARFAECTGNVFECSRIVGRKFESLDDHASYVRDGGCSDIIQVLATQC